MEIMKSKDYIPKNTNDVESVEVLRNLPFEELRKDIPVLLEWLQDLHWDVARGVAKYLIPHINEMTQELLFILNSDDGMWKYCVINGLIAQSQEKLDPALVSAIRRIAENPSKIDIEDSVNEAAEAIMTSKHLFD